MFAAAPTYKVVEQDQDRRRDTLGLRLRGSREPSTVCFARNADRSDRHQHRKVVGTITETNGVHGIAIADDLGRGFISDGGDNDVTVFDLKTLRSSQGQDRPESGFDYL